MDSIDTFVSCFSHPFNSLVDFDEDKLKDDKNLKDDFLKDDLKCSENKDKNKDKNQMNNETIKRELSNENQRRKDRKNEFPLITDINKNYQKNDFKTR